MSEDPIIGGGIFSASSALPPRPRRVLIIGGGLAGAATAWHLTRLGSFRVVLLERESVCGLHASGRNAAMVRQAVADPEVGRLAREGAAFLRNPPAGLAGRVPYSPCGSWLLASGEAWRGLQRQAAAAREDGVPAEACAPERARAVAPYLGADPGEGAVRCPTDGVTDPHALLDGFLRGARDGGAEIRTGCPALGLRSAGGRVTGVETAAGAVDADVVVNAAGAWASGVGAWAGGGAIPLRPHRRHLLLLGPAPSVDPRGPIVWDESRGVYVRPETGGALASPCDETPWPAGLPPADPAAADRLHDKLARTAPALLELPVRRAWACLRTLAPDGRFVIGWDPRTEGLFWVAGLGGHGVAASPAVGALAARRIAAGPGTGDSSDPFSPGRMLP